MVNLVRAAHLITFVILALTFTSSDGKSIVSKVKEFKNEVKAGHDLNYESPSFLTKMVTHIFEAFNLKQVLHDIKISKTTDATCHTCKFGISLLQHLLEFGKSKEEVAHLAHTICVALHVEKPRVCRGIVESYKDELIMVIAQLTITPSEICGIILGDTCAHVFNPLYNWTLPLTPIAKPPVEPWVTPLPGAPTFKVLQLSDTHIDTMYQEGGDAECGEPLCCRTSERNTPLFGHEKAGFWGDYRDCDIPMRTFESMLKFIQVNHQDLDFVFWTGDVPAHDIWNQTRSGQIGLIRNVSNLMSKYLSRVPILPALGNHESAPVNSFPRPEVTGKSSISWLYNELDDIWSNWLPPTARASIKKGAYYSLNLKPGLKLISLNMNYCNNQNWWLLLNSTDPADELTWLVNELQESELIHQKVLIIGHIPPGSNDCLQVWSSNYYRIINRYESTITAQFFGHTHQDEFELFYEESNDLKRHQPHNFAVATNEIRERFQKFEDLRPTSIAYIGPSVTTFGGVNPGYRIYTIDATTFRVIDHETFYANLTTANNDPSVPLHFMSSYKATSEYNMNNLSPSEWHNLIVSMVTDQKLFRKFEKLFFNKSDAFKPCTDNVCKADILCRLISGKAHDYDICQKFLKDLDMLSNDIDGSRI